ncbi:MAG: Siderophore biosynthesis non-ribosomal peptide synthetase, Bacillibactin synthetase [Streptosporangiaceae bacterium]|nr:Siderophore biosynthesis non-ribosomal peptide synthetase, Bacillibactin synthetase [Streptosporangiaceae bacterium]
MTGTDVGPMSHAARRGEITLSDLTEWHVLANPEAVAVSYPGEGVTLTYSELSHRANQLASFLIAQGVGPGDRVVTCLRAGSDLVIAFLGIVRAGAAYVPVDPAHPLERRRLIVRDCEARAVVTTETFASDCAGLLAMTVAVDTLTETIAAQPASVPDVNLAPEDAAYVCYTSGTTGTPKGVVVPHRAVVDLVQSTDYVRLTHRDVVAQAANPAFDAVTFEIWGALTSGARVLGLSKDTVVDPAAFERAVREHGVTVLFLTTALFNQIARERPSAFAPLRVLLFGGEACDPRRVREVFAAQPPHTLLHVYGPTETTTFATWHEVAEPADGARTIPIGRPIGATVAHVLDEAGQRVSPRGTGELYLGGPCLALGYLGRADLTQERFVDDPFAADGSKLYRTGDRVLVRPDGAIEFLGRVDNQIKLRGFRIELGEIEAVLTSHPGVAQAVVSLHEAEDDRRLVAHVVPAAAAAAETSEQVTEWREIYETLYDDAKSAGFGENFTGWNSSYDAEPIPLDQMEEWRAATVERIRGLRPRRVLEIGVGTGLLLSRLAPDCEDYWGTDFSASVIEALRSQTEADPRLREKVTLSCRAADVTDGLPAGHFDTIVINSVIQYFPNLDYLRTVLERALPLLAPGGSVFLGDLRNLDLLRCMQTGVELAQGGGGQDRERLGRAIDQRVALETELLLSPALFSALAGDLPAIRSVDVRIKRGVHHNELTRYRYDVVLSTREPVADLRAVPRLDWDTQLNGIAELEEYLRTQRPAVLRVAAVPNRRIHGEYAAMREMDAGGTTAAALERLAGTGSAPDPEALCAAGEGLGYRAFTTWSADSDEAFDVLFLASAGIPDGPLTYGYAVDPAAAPAAADCANTPTAFDRTVDLSIVLRSYLQEQLPDYMVPAALMTLEALPLTPNGKVDRRALPSPVFAAASPGTQPGTPIEEILRDLFAEVLGLPKREVYADSDFFALGGHSLAAARLVARLRATLGADPSSRALYEAPTPVLLAALLHGPGPQTVADGALPRPEGVQTGNLVLPLRLRGALNTKALASALRDLENRHEALRTALSPDGEDRACGAQDLAPLPLTAVRPADADVPQLLRAAQHRTLDSATERPCNAELFAFAPDDHLLVLALPPAAVDAGSHLPLAADLAAAYAARTVGDVLRPESSPRPAEAAARREPAPAAASPLPTPLPVAVPQEQNPGFGTWETAIDAALHRRLAEFAAEHGTTLFMLVHTALATLLTRLGAGTDIVLSTPVPARGDDALRRAVGPYTRMLALRTDTSGDPAFAALLRRVRGADLAAYRLEAAPQARPGGVVLAVAEQTGADFESAGLAIQVEQPLLPNPDAELALLLTERQSATGAPLGITVNAAFRRSAVDEGAAASLTDRLVALLDSALEDPGSRISRLPLAFDDALARTQREANGGQRTVAPATVPELFARQAGHAPDTLALVHAGEEMTYAELDARSDRLARTLMDHKAGPGTAVATAIASPVGFAVAALAVAKSGAVCQPLDPDAGARQITDRLTATRPVVLLVDASAEESVPETPGAARLLQDPEAVPGAAVRPLLDADRFRPLTTDHPVLLATAAGSGAGEALIGPLPIATDAARRAEELPGARSAWLVRRYPDADAALGLLGVLASGGTVLVPDARWSDELPGLLDWLRDSAADELLASDADAAELCRAAEAQGRGPAPVRAFTVSTPRDGASPDTVGFARAHGLALTVRGGPAEARLVTVQASGADARHAWNHRAYVLDEALRPVPPGTTGALYLAGAGIALGYANRPGTTGERFVPDPFEAPGSRMWRAARAAQRGSDGGLDVLGELWTDDPFEDEYGTFAVLANDRGQRALWPTTVPVPDGWHEAHPEDLRELCLDDLNEHPTADLEIGN